MSSLKWQGFQKSSLQSPCADPRGSSFVPLAVPSPSSHVWRPGTKANGFSAGLIVSPCCTAPPYQPADQHFVTAAPSGLACSAGCPYCESPLKNQLLSRLLSRARIALGRLMGLCQHKCLQQCWQGTSYDGLDHHCIHPTRLVGYTGQVSPCLSHKYQGLKCPVGNFRLV